MENFKKYTCFKKQFMDEHLCEVSSVVVKYASPHISLSFTGQKLPNALLSTSISYVQSNFKLQGKILPNDQYLYKCFYTPLTIPLFFKGRCQVGNSLTGTLIENDLEVQYKHTSANFAIKLKDNLTNLVISNTLGNEFLGFNAKLKTNLRCDEILKFNAGVYFVKKNCKFMCKYSYFDSQVDVWYQQAVLGNFSVVQSFSFCSLAGLKNLQIGAIHEYSGNTRLKFNANSQGKVTFGCFHSLSDRIQVISFFSTNANKTSTNSLDYSIGFNLHISI